MRKTACLRAILIPAICGLVLLACGGSNEGSDLRREVDLLQTQVATSPTQTSANSQQSAPATATLAPSTATTVAAPAVATQIPTPTQAPAPALPDSIRIPRIGVDAPLRPQVVGPDGYFGGGDNDNVVEIYDLTALGGLGGSPGAGNTIVSGNQRPGLGNFQHLNTLQVGDEIVITYRGQPYRYSAVIVCRAPNPDFARILTGGQPERVTLLQASGTGATTWLYAVAERQQNTVSRTCPVGSPP